MKKEKRERLLVKNIIEMVLIKVSICLSSLSLSFFLSEMGGGKCKSLAGWRRALVKI